MKVEIFDTGFTCEIDRSFQILIKDGSYEVVARKNSGKGDFTEVVLKMFPDGNSARIYKESIEEKLKNET